MSRLIRRFGPQALLLTSAFATAVLLALVFRPAARIGPIPTPISATAPVREPSGAEAEREAAQAKLAEAMARFANTAPKATEPAAQLAAPAPAEVTREPDPPPALARAIEPEPAPAAKAMRPALPPLSETDKRRLDDKMAQAIRDGDIYGARLILEKLIESGDARALLNLAETYDPKGLARLNAKGVKPDVARARALYTQAQDNGVAGARAKLEAMDR